MRIGAYLLLETSLALALLGVGGWQVARNRGVLRQALTGWTIPTATERPPVVAPREELTAERDDLRLTLETSGMFLGMSDELLLGRMRTQAPTRFKVNKGGSSLSFRVDFADGSRAAFKPLQTNLQSIPRKEVAAYRLNRLLGLNAVPPAVTRSFTLKEILTHLHPESEGAVARIQAETIVDARGLTRGELSYWIPVLKESGLDTPAGREQTLAWLSQSAPFPAADVGRAVQVSNLAVFDFLIDNPDRYSGGNMKASADGQVLYFMDNTMSFFTDPQGIERTRGWLAATERFSRSLVAALDKLDEAALAQLSADRDVDGGEGPPLLTQPEREAVLSRRDYVRRHVASLVETHGRDAVLCFP